MKSGIAAKPKKRIPRKKTAEKKPPTEYDKRYPSRLSPAIDMLAQNVKRLRQSRGWTQQALASRLEVEQRNISLIEAGRASPSVMTVEAIATVFGVSIADLFIKPAAS